MMAPLPLLLFLNVLPCLSNAFYTSPSIHPSPQGDGTGDWSEAYSRASSLVASMTLEEMNNITYGHTPSNGCSGVSGSAPRVNFPGLCLQDAGNGVRGTDGVNAYPAGIHVGASWNEDLAYNRALDMGREFRAKGVSVALGPVVGPLGRTATGGRNWEGFSADPYLEGILGAQSVRGLQKSVIASVKHYIANEQETNRNPSGGSLFGKRAVTVPASSSNVDDKTMHEVYLWPFQDAIQAGAACIMCSYQRINQTYGCENSKTLNGLLKEELKFQGFVLSDWGAQRSGLPSANAGLDMVMPDSRLWNASQLVEGVNSGQLDRKRLVDMATRIVAAWYYIGQDSADYPELGAGLPLSILQPHEYVDVRDPEAAPRIFQQAVEGHVLVKNVNNALPLKKPKVLSVYGYDAVEQNIFNPNPLNLGGFSIDFWQLNSQAITVSLPALLNLSQNLPPDPELVPQIFQGTLLVGGGSGSNTPPYISSPYSALANRAQQDGSALFHDFNGTSPNVVSSSTACLVFINEWASEQYDRPSLAHGPSDALVTSVANKCNNTMVVIHNAGIRLVDAWIDHPNITAVIYAHLPGQDSGRALVDILYGEQSPSGRLPYTVAKKASDYGPLLGPCLENQNTDPQCNYDEGVAVDYRWLSAYNITPRYEFGYGLTYSSFSYSNLSISTSYALDSTPLGETIVGGPSGLFDNMISIGVTIKNTGSVAAAEVAQLYLLIPGGVTKQLRGFKKVLIEPGQEAQVEFHLRRRDVSTWDIGKQTWIVPKGEFKVDVGASVLDTKLTGSFTN